MSCYSFNHQKCCCSFNLHREGYRFVALFSITTLFFLIMGGYFGFFWGLGVISAILTGLTIYFFRDPMRIVPVSSDIVVSPADGIVTDITDVEAIVSSDGNVKQHMKCVSIFLSVFDVHVNRAPVSGTVEFLNYRKGAFISATMDKSSELNEKQIICLKDEADRFFVVEQIAGFIARRIVCNLGTGQKVRTGDKFGIIRFGSRVNIMVPEQFHINVNVGQTVIGGETLIAGMHECRYDIEYHCV